jgi:hypothetical protein
MGVWISAAALVVVTAAFFAAVRVDAQERSAGPPPNLTGGAYQQLIDRIWRESPTFRAQCDRLAAEPQLRIVIRGESKPSTWGSGRRAKYPY